MVATDRDKHLSNFIHISNCTTEKYFIINSSNLMKMLVYNQKYRILLSALLHGVIPHGQQTRLSKWFHQRRYRYRTTTI